ncbi:hypothetical protein [Modestobacter roseus]|nr:hypothetical protein [Modestobacter roseus]MQA32007.1 hypothetical protein [Modestobacter roseus]
MRTRQLLRRVAPWLAVLVPLVQVGLVVADVLPVRTAVVVAVVLEVLLAGVFLAEAALFRGAYRRIRQGGGSRGSAVLAGAEAALPRPVYWNLEVTDDQVALSVMGETSVRLTVRPGASVTLDGQPLPATAVALFADDPRRLVRELRTRLADPARG